ncbi:hemerythrin domain-containing protein [Streptoalloteichus hindustanus]|uniref:Hemerythrin HHE cation binding domain-containing protein n=1 Tax=Streptoalloteichus hindustanus TaxID=2017 RepID=A0A1M5FQ10_STRHI|nr:hemerythrin domain-containing protein [Streptoalloteichus hindustanus]SHF93637.1 Hemerythrin HHE cation binding domain-containing protein [Streptoalloteichus hindustanus]
MAEEREQDVVDLLISQHNQIRSLFDQVRTAQGDRKRELFQDLVRLLAVHETAEEETVHPVARRKIDNGEQVVEARLAEEDEAKHVLAELHDLGVDHPEFDTRLERFAQSVIDHATHEENEEFVHLRQHLDADQSRRLATAVRAAEATAPTRPHPGAGESAMANLLAGPPMAVFDRVRDAVRDWRQSHRED